MVILRVLFVIFVAKWGVHGVENGRGLNADAIDKNFNRVKSNENLLAKEEKPVEARNNNIDKNRVAPQDNGPGLGKKSPLNNPDAPRLLNKVADAGNNPRLPPLRGKVRERPQLPAGLATSEQCAEDVQRYCGHRNFQSNLEVLACLTNSVQDDEDLDEECHRHVWEFKLNITKDEKFEGVARDICRPMISKIPSCAEVEYSKGKLIPCLLEHKNELDLRPCYHFVLKMATIIYSDYRLICNFVDECESDIKKYECGRINAKAKPDDPKSHSQGAVVRCLEEVIVKGDNVEESCAKQIVRLSELSSDDFHLDRNLFFACRDDRERLCEEITSGEGRVYKCLFRHKFDHQMSTGCRDALTTRQKLVAQDYKASYELQKYCQQDIDTLQCTKHPEYQVGGINDHDDIIGVSGMLLCLESARHAENGYEISQHCDEQLTDFRRMLSENYQMSPEIVKNCGNEIHSSCSDEGMQKNGETIHCLMALAQDSKDGGQSLSQDCEVAILHLLKEEQAVSDYRMDYALAEACSPVVETVCSSHPEGDPLVLSCLMEHLHSDAMLDECRKRLLELQYFISRDFYLDETFFKKCHKDADELCDIDDLKNANTNEVNMPFSLVVSCLYRHIPGAPGGQEQGDHTSRSCAEEVKKAMKDRALEFHLNPDLEKACIHSLGLYCSQSVIEKGYELVCLQDHFEDIADSSNKGDEQAKACVKQLEEITEIEEAEAGNLDNILLRACENDVDNFCSDERDEDEEGELMKCLIKNKYQLTKNCEVGVTHFQLIEIKDIKFNYNFMKACEEDISINCSELVSGSHTKNEVVECLSKQYLESILQNEPSPISEKCRQQLKVENFQKHEDIKLNPELKKSCQTDYKKLCKDKAGKIAPIECLRLHHDKISPKCRKQLFKLEREEVILPELDVTLKRSCKGAITKFCQPALDQESVLDCLVHHKDRLSQMCRSVVTEREREKYADINLNLELKQACQNDIKKYCDDILETFKQHEDAGEDMTGEVTACLKDVELNGNEKESLSQECSKHIRFIVKEEENDYKLDPVLTLHCLRSIESFCKPDVVTNVVECLKQMYFQNKLSKEPKCMFEVARMLREGRFDIMADPVLHNACQLDIHHYCADVAEGKSRIMVCLLDVIESGRRPITQQCSEALSQRKQMWQFAAKHNVESFKGIANAIWNSPQQSYLLTGITFFLVSVLIVGMLCGRMTKRISRQRKML